MKNLKIAKLIISMFLIIIVTNDIKSQYSIAGIKGSIFVDITPDTLLNPYPLSFSHEIFYVDINQDNIDDIKIDEFGGVSPGSSNLSVYISSLNSFTSFSFGSRDSTFIPANPPCPNQYSVRTILKVYNYGDTINDGIYVDGGFLTYNHRSGPCPDATSYQWLNKSNVCFGVKYQTSTDTLFGWVKVDVISQSAITIKEYSLGSPSKNINPNNSYIISVYPNPAKNTIIVSIPFVSNESTLIIYNIVGQELLKQQITDIKTRIDISNLTSGIYFVRVKTENGMREKKIIKV
jgi:hypothetical protein